MTSNALIPISTEVHAELATEATETTQAMALLQAFEIANDDDLAYAGNVVKTVKERWKALEAKRTAITAPMNKALQAVQDLFNPIQHPLKAAEAVLKQKIGAYTLAQRAAQEASMQAAAEAIRTGGDAAPHVAALAPVASVAGASVKPVWDWHIWDPDGVPRHLCSPDPAKIAAAMPKDVRQELAPQIEGVRVWVRGHVTVRTA